MAITTAIGGTISSASSAFTYTTTAFTPTAGDLLFLAFELEEELGGTITITDSQAGTWTLVASASRVAGLHGNYLYVRTSTASASSMTVTVTDNQLCGGCNGSVWSLAGVNGVGSAAVVQSKKGAGASGTPAVTFDATTVTTNAVLAVVFNEANPSGVTAPTGWTAGSNIGHTFDMGEATSYRNSGFAGTTVTWGSTASEWGAYVVEVLAAAGSAQTEPLPSYVPVVNALPPTIIGTLCEKTTGSTVMDLTASVSALTKAIVFITMDADLSVTSLTDTKGNRYTVVVTDQQGTGDAGIKVELWISNLQFVLTAGVDQITAVFSGLKSAGCMSAYGTNLQMSTLEGTSVSHGAGTAPSTSVANAVAPAYGFVCCGVEGPDTDVYTEDADWTAITNTGTTGGGAETNVSINTAWIQLGTAVTTGYTPTLGTSRDFATVQAVFSYLDADPVVTTQQLLPLTGCGG